MAEKILLKYMPKWKVNAIFNSKIFRFWLVLHLKQLKRDNEQFVHSDFSFWREDGGYLWTYVIVKLNFNWIVTSSQEYKREIKNKISSNT